jgi:hypothetical protein
MLLASAGYVEAGECVHLTLHLDWRLCLLSDHLLSAVGWEGGTSVKLWPVAGHTQAGPYLLI